MTSVRSFVNHKWPEVLWVFLLLSFFANVLFLMWPKAPSHLEVTFTEPKTTTADVAEAALTASLDEIEAAQVAAHGGRSRSRHAAHPSKVLKTVYLNKATLADLQHLPGVGPSMAKKILAARQKLGGRFTTIEQLLDVKGIGAKKFAKMKPYLHLD